MGAELLRLTLLELRDNIEAKLRIVVDTERCLERFRTQQDLETLSDIERHLSVLRSLNEVGNDIVLSTNAVFNEFASASDEQPAVRVDSARRGG